MSLIYSQSCCSWDLFMQCCVEEHGLKTKLKQHNPLSHQRFNQFNWINLYCVWKLQALATESPFCADFSLFWCYNWKQRCSPRRMWQSPLADLWMWSCLSDLASSVQESLCHVPVNIIKMWCSPRHDLNQTVDPMRNSLKLENFPVLLEKLNKLLLSLSDIWRQPSECYLHWKKIKGCYRWWHLTEGRAASEVHCLMKPLAHCIINRSQ